MSNYKHLTREERYQIQAYKKAGFSQVEIAKELIVHKSKSCTSDLNFGITSKL